MNTYVALLRGINVSGHKLIKMADLRMYMEELKFKNIQTYIQSGNIIFETKSSDVADLEKKIETKISEKYGFEVPAIIITPEEIQNIIDKNIFLLDETKTVDRIYVVLLNKKPEEQYTQNLKAIDYYPEDFLLFNKHVYLFSPEGYAKSKLSIKFFEKKFKAKATARNWNTINKLLELTIEK